MYIALRSMQVQGADGNTRQVKPGDDVPEAAGWKNLRAYLNRGSVCLKDGAISDRTAAKIVARAVGDKDRTIARLKKENLELRERYESSVATAPSDASPEHEGGGELTESEMEPVSGDDPKLTRQELQEMSKDSLMTLADSMGIDPGQTGKKLAKAIFAEQ